MRAFLAVDLTDRSSKESIVKVQRELASSGADIKLVEAENLHFTLRFLGEISEAEADGICEALKGLKYRSFKVSYKGLGVFPSTRRVSVVWVGVGEGADELKKLAEIVEDRLKHLNFKPERSFVPHLTICRVRSGRNRENLVKAVEEHGETFFGNDSITSVKLKRSQLTPKGPIYSDIFVVPLEGEGGGEQA